MAEVTIPESSVVPIEHVAAGIEGLRIAFVNVYGIRQSDGSWILLDAGLPFSATLIRNWAEKHFQHPPAAIVLTHGHFDHVSAARDLGDAWDVPIFAHAQEFPYLTGQREYPAPNFAAGGGLMSWLSPLYPRGGTHLGGRLRALTSEEEEGILRGWKIVHTPGHTPGHVSLFRPEDSVLLAGDAFCTTKPESFFDAAIGQPPELHGPPAYFTQDWDAAIQSIQKLMQLNPAVVAPGHGKPLAGNEVASGLRLLAQELLGEQRPIHPAAD